jgi:hypothetical protein
MTLKQDTERIDTYMKWEAYKKWAGTLSKDDLEFCLRNLLMGSCTVSELRRKALKY